MSYHSSPHAVAIADKLRHYPARAFRLLNTLKAHNSVLAYLFVVDGFYLTRLKALMESSEEVQHQLQARSFWALISDPANGFQSSTRIGLQLQTIDLYWRYFCIDRVTLYPVGRARFGLINPEVEIWRERVNRNECSFSEGRMMALYWLHTATSLSVSGLETALTEQSIRYADKNASIPPVGGQTGQFEALIERQPFDIVWLRASKDVDELLARLGLSDITGGQIYLSAFRPRPKDTP